MSVHRRVTSRGTRYDVRLRDPDGRSYKRTFRNRRDAQAFEARELADRSRGAWIDPRRSAVTFEEWVRQWSASTVGRRPKTVAWYARTVDLHLVPAFGSRALGSLTPLDVQAFVDTLATRFAPATTRGYYAVLRLILNAAVNADLIGRSPCRGIRLPPSAPTSRRLADPSEVHRLADAIEPGYRAMVLVAAELGLRWGECAGLQIRDLDVLRRSVTVRLNIGEVNGVLDVGEPKTNAGRRTVAASAPLMAELAEHLRRRGLTAENADAWVFAAPGAARFGTRSSDRVSGCPPSARAKLDGLTFHGLRHAAATALGGRWSRPAHRPAPARARDPETRARAVRGRDDRG